MTEIIIECLFIETHLVFYNDEPLYLTMIRVIATAWLTIWNQIIASYPHVFLHLAQCFFSQFWRKLRGRTYSLYRLSSPDFNILIKLYLRASFSLKLALEGPQKLRKMHFPVGATSTSWFCTTKIKFSYRHFFQSCSMIYRKSFTKMSLVFLENVKDRQNHSFIEVAVMRVVKNPETFFTSLRFFKFQF